MAGGSRVGAQVVTRADRRVAAAFIPRRPELWVSHETIYQSLYVQARGALRKELTAHLRRRRTYRRPRGHSTYNGQGQLRGTLNISARPPEATDRAVPGHWESQWCCQAA